MLQGQPAAGLRAPERGQQGAGVLRGGLSVVDECAPANTSALPLADMLGVGWGTDGSDGSLCSLSPADDPVPAPPTLCSWRRGPPFMPIEHHRRACLIRSLQLALSAWLMRGQDRARLPC